MNEQIYLLSKDYGIWEVSFSIREYQTKVCVEGFDVLTSTMSGQFCGEPRESGGVWRKVYFMYSDSRFREIEGPRVSCKGWHKGLCFVGKVYVMWVPFKFIKDKEIARGPKGRNKRYSYKRGPEETKQFRLPLKS